MKKKKWFEILLSFLVILGGFFQSKSATISAEGTAQPVDVAVTDLSIQRLNGEQADRMFISDRFLLSLSWDASAQGANLHQGDYFDVVLPDEMKFPSSSTASDFNIYGPDGTSVVAIAHVTPGLNENGGAIRATFTDWVEGKENVKGTIHLGAQFDEERVAAGQTNVFNLTVSGKVTPIQIVVTGPTELQGEVLTKWGSPSEENRNQAAWYVRINHAKATLSNMTLSDHLSEGTGTETYIPDSFELLHVTYDPKGAIVQGSAQVVDLSGKLAIAPDGRSYTINMGNVNGDQYFLSYKTTYTHGTTLRNNVNLNSYEQTQSTSATSISSDSGGQGTGDNTGKITLKKVDAQNNSILLAGATFEVSRVEFQVTALDEAQSAQASPSSFQLTTGADGTITSGPVTPGYYTIREVIPPAGYILNEEVYDLEVTSTGASVLTISNEPIQTSVSVAKKWIGPAGNQVIVHLLADGEDTGKTITLNAQNNWTGTFDQIRKYTLQGAEIAYTVKEETPEGYQSAVSGTQLEGYTITNTIAQTISIPVTKQWVGQQGSEVTVKLLADQKDTGKTITLNADGNWSGSFEGLPQYDPADGHEIEYAVAEVSVPGYTSVITGSASAGFTIINTIAGKVSIPVTKVWAGKEGTSATIHLLADGKEADSITLDAKSGWTYTFKNLDKYKDGKEIVYTVKEDSIENYSSKITGDIKSGFTITNTNTETLSIPVVKKWVGKAADKVEIQLLADKKVKDTATLTAASDWKYTFNNLAKYDLTDGHEIEYTIAEVSIPGYTSVITGSPSAGFTITNTIAGKVSIPVTKVWAVKEGTSATIHLLADGKEIDSITLDAKSGWSYTFANLDQYKDGKEITYTVKEDPIKNYTTTITGDAKSGFTITNTNTEKTSVSIEKKWVGLPADSITVSLLANGKEIRTQNISKDTNWKYRFDDLDKYKDGKEIEYTIQEKEMAAYTTKISGNAASGFTITNTRKPTTPPKDGGKKGSNKPKSPKTGIDSNLLLYGGLLIVSFGAIVFLITVNKGRKS